MKRCTRFTIVSLVALMLLCSTFVAGSGTEGFAADNQSTGNASAAQTFSAQFGKYFVTTAWVKANLGSILLIDTRSATAYAAGHIKGAINVPSSTYYMTRVEGTDGTNIKCMIPTLPEFTKLVNSWGVKSANTVVVTYGDGDENDWGLSARLAWTLQLYGHKKAYNMDGGFPKWYYMETKKSTKYTTTVATLPKANTTAYVLDSYSDILATKYDVLDVVNATVSNGVLLDTRTPGEWAGTTTFAGNPRSGRITGAVELTWTDVFTQGGTDDSANPIYILKTETELRALVEPLVGKKTDAPVKTIMPYCEAGFRSAHVTFVLLGLGYPSVRHYQGAWSEWSRQDPATYPAWTP